MTQPHDVQVGERSSIPIHSCIAEEVPSEFWRAADCTIKRSPGDVAWTLTAGDSVGVSRITTAGWDVTLTVSPKLVDADIFFLADYAFDQRHEPLRILNFDEPMLAAVRSDPTACLLLWHVNSINRFASRWLRRDYRTTDQVFNGKVKGRILLDRYVKNHLAVGRANEIPCRTIEQTQDTPNNRLLKAGLRYAAALSHTLPVIAAGNAVRRQVAAALPKFSQVSDIEVTTAALRATTVRGPQRHYAMVLRATRSLLGNRFTGIHSGSLSTESFMWQMPTLFQESVRGIVSMIADVELDSSRPPTARIYNGSGRLLRSSKVDPDLILRTGNGRNILLDTKYKNVLTGHTTPSGTDTIELSDKERITVSRSDVYQAVAYRHHDRWANETTISGLLFPVSLPAGAKLPQALQIHGFGRSIPLLFIDIGPCARQNVEQFRQSLLALQTDDVTTDL